MGQQKAHIEMAKIDLSAGWRTLAGFPDGLEVKMLSDSLDEVNKTGARSRLVRFSAGAATTAPLIHDYWEEVYLVTGDLAAIGEPAPLDSTAPSYSCRPPGTPHGPFKSISGCLLVETQYYVK